MVGSFKDHLISIIWILVNMLKYNRRRYLEWYYILHRHFRWVFYERLPLHELSGFIPFYAILHISKTILYVVIKDRYLRNTIHKGKMLIFLPYFGKIRTGHNTHGSFNFVWTKSVFINSYHIYLNRPVHCVYIWYTIFFMKLLNKYARLIKRIN